MSGAADLETLYRGWLASFDEHFEGRTPPYVLAMLFGQPQAHPTYPNFQVVNLLVGYDEKYRRPLEPGSPSLHPYQLQGRGLMIQEFGYSPGALKKWLLTPEGQGLCRCVGPNCFFPIPPETSSETATDIRNILRDAAASLARNEAAAPPGKPSVGGSDG